MTKEEEPGIEEYFDHVLSVFQENERFLRAHSQDAYEQVIGLYNDGIDYIGLALDQEGYPEQYLRSATHYYLNHILTPVAGAIVSNLFMGNIPACFMELRLALESLVKSHMADKEFPNLDFFQERLHCLEDKCFQEELSISKLMKSMDAEFDTGSNFISLWGRLSGGWLHARGVMDAIVNNVIRTSEVPPWALVIPVNLSRGDLEDIGQLRDRASEFRALMSEVMDSAL